MDKYLDRILDFQLRNPLAAGPAIEDLDGPLSLPAPQPPTLQEICVRRAVLVSDLEGMPPMLLDLMLEYACRHNLLTPELLVAAAGEVINLSNYGRADFSASDALRQLAAAVPPVHTLLLSWCYTLQVSALLEALDSVGSQLRVLHLWKCSEINDDCLQAITHHCTQLENFDVRGCQRLSAGARAEVLVACERLQHVQLGMKLDDSAALAAAKLEDLQHFNVPHSAAISGPAAACLGQCQQLRSLNVSHSAIDREALRAIAQGCSQLKVLNLERCRDLDDDALSELAVLRALEQLYLTGTRVSERSLAALPRLKRLKVDECHSLTDLPSVCLPTEVLSAVKCRLHSIGFHRGCTLRVVDLSMTQLHAASASDLPLACAEMRCLVLKSVHWLTGQLLQELLAACHTTLQHFDMDQSNLGPFPSSADVARLAQCRRLETLAFGGHLVGPSALAEILQNCPRIMSIDSYCEGLHKPDLQSGWSLATIMRRFPHYRFAKSTHNGIGMIIHRIQFNAFKHGDQDTRIGGTFEDPPAELPAESRDEDAHREREARIAAAVQRRLASDEDVSEEVKDTITVLRLLNDNLSEWLPKLKPAEGQCLPEARLRAASS